jgi:hypothetical protein
MIVHLNEINCTALKMLARGDLGSTLRHVPSMLHSRRNSASLFRIRKEILPSLLPAFWLHCGLALHKAESAPRLLLRASLRQTSKVIVMAITARASVIDRANMTNLLIGYSACRLAGGRVGKKE